MRELLDIYATQIKTSLATSFQYRMANLFWLIGMMVEPVIYLVVWSAVATSQGGQVAGYTAGGFAAYYIVWTLVRQMNIALTPYEFEGRVQRGELSPMLMRPVHPFHIDMAGFVGFKIVTLILWVPVAAVLAWVFRPELDPTWWQALAFCVALVTGYVMRFVLLWVLGMATFWTTRVSAVFELYFTLELLLSGRLVPLELMPAWVRRITDLLPFKWTFGFPIEVVLGRLSAREVLTGFAAQAIWFAIGAAVLNLVWRAGVRRYSAVGA
ncbi:MAG TPA: ABC-2 family transporter protein [Herpetosiphonaceae bacterium]